MARCYIGGTFDLFHHGHVELLKAASEYGDVWVSLNTDEFAGRYKRPPVMSLKERSAVVSACRYVAGVVVNAGDEDSKPAILTVKPQFIVHGDDWTGEGLMKQMGLTDDFMLRHGIKFLYLPYTAGVSSSDVIKRAAANFERKWY